MIEDVRGDPDEPKRPAAPRKRGLGRGLGAILSTPGHGDEPDGDEHQARHDPLTGLPNRLLLDQRLEHALATCRQDDAALAVLVVALDGFSKVNELFGHRVGDDLLHDVAERMSAARRRSDTVARFAGDEFVVVCPYVGSAELACQMAERILEDVSLPTSVDGVEHHLTASIGVVVTTPGEVAEDTEMLETILGDAVLAMRHAKDDGGASWRLFDPSMRAHAADRYQYRQDLRAAMENGELVLEYEQIVDLESCTAIGQSARLGWQHSAIDRPEALLDVVDDAGLAIPVGRWVLDEALSVLAARRATSNLPADFRVWVKVSPSFVADTALVESVDELTAKHRIPPSMIGLDIGEPSATALPTAEPALEALAGRGIGLMLDGFGSTPSNLALLQRLPISGLKLSPEVVAGLDDLDDDAQDGDWASEVPDPDGPDAPDGAALVRGLVGLGRALGLTVVAQGVTSEFQVATLRSLGCGFAQGPFLGNGPDFEPRRAAPVVTVEPVPDARLERAADAAPGPVPEATHELTLLREPGVRTDHVPVPVPEATLAPTPEPSHEPASEPSHEPASEPSHEPASEPSHEPASEPLWATGPDARPVSLAPDDRIAPDDPDATRAPDRAAAQDAREAPGTSDAPGTPGGRGTPDELCAQDVPDVPDVPEVPDAQGTPDVPGTTPPAVSRHPSGLAGSRGPGGSRDTDVRRSPFGR
ncbi:MAG TPA: diguanylate cyclase [Acidimicrobiales bacterium]|nr:diguanylate cyclase [Acidimicrobiales bacterium]